MAPWIQAVSVSQIEQDRCSMVYPYYMRACPSWQYRCGCTRAL